MTTFLVTTTLMAAVAPPAMATQADTVLVLPIVSRTPGFADTRWRSAAWIFNPASAEASVELEWYPSSPEGLPAPAAVETLRIGAGAQLFVEDVVGDLYGATGNGAVRMVSDRPIRVFVRVFNDKTSEPYDGGTFGQGVVGLPSSAPLARGVLLGLSYQSPSHQAGFRTNLGMFNPGPAPVSLTLTARAADGTPLGETTREVAGHSHLQGAVYDLIWSVPQAQRERDHLVVTYEVSGGPLYLYASVVDNVTGDGVLLLPQTL